MGVLNPSLQAEDRPGGSTSRPCPKDSPHQPNTTASPRLTATRLCMVNSAVKSTSTGAPLRSRCTVELNRGYNTDWFRLDVYIDVKLTGLVF